MQAHANSPERVTRTPLLGGWAAVVSLAIVVGFCAVGMAQDEPNLAPQTTAVSAEPMTTESAAGPYVAEVTGNDVFIRSGPGTNFYHCGKLYAGDRIQVITSRQGWSGIVPPPGCFSWVSMRYVSINLENPTMGIITGDNVGVYAGSDYVLPMHSTSKQATLSRGEHLKLLGEEKDDYYKIAPTEGALLWVSSQYAQAADRRPPIVDVGAMVKPPATSAVKTEPKTDLDVYYILSEQINAQREMPVADQDYTEIKKKLVELAAKKDAGRAARYAEFTVKQVDRYELACKVAKELDLQNKELQKVSEKIDEARATKLAQVEDLGKFAIMGTLENSTVYTGRSKRFRILDESGKTICYVTPTGPAASVDFTKLIGHKVGLVGKIAPHEATARAFVEFTEIVPLDQ